MKQRSNSFSGKTKYLDKNNFHPSMIYKENLIQRQNPLARPMSKHPAVELFTIHIPISPVVFKYITYWQCFV